MKMLLLTCVFSLIATQVLAITSRNWGAYARISSPGGGTIYTEAPPVGPEPAFDGTTGFITSDSGNIPPGLFNGEPYPIIQAGAEATFGLTQGFLSAGGTYAAQSSAPNPTIFNGRAQASAQFQEEMIILPTAEFPMGTLFDVRMVLAAAYSADTQSAPAAFESGLVTTRFDARLQNAALGGGGINRYFKSLPSTEIISGLALTGVGELTDTVAVGYSFQISAQIAIDSQGSVQTHGAGNVNNTISTGFALGTLAFGFEVVGPAAASVASANGSISPEITYLSGGAAPLASAVSVAYATANLPDFEIFIVPEPSSAVLLITLAALSILSRRRGCAI
jgi:hypothetical protein